MSGSLRIGIVGGAGWLGCALAKAILKEGVVKADSLALSYRRRKPTDLPDVFCTAHSQELADKSDVVIVSVRPEDWPSLDVDVDGKLMISVMAGVKIGSLSDKHSTNRIVRTLPNAGAEVGLSYTPWVASPAVSQNDRAVVRSIFSACGIEDEVSNEAQIDYLTGLSGSGPAFPALLASAMIDHAKSQGLSEAVAKRAVIAVLKGTGRLFELRDHCPNDLVQTFVDYRGTTAAALLAMRHAGFDAAVAAGLSAAFTKSVSMGDAS